MSQKTDKDTEQELPAIPDLTQDKLHRLMCADYLESVAGMIRRGQVNAFDLSWDLSTEQPVGRVEVDSSTLISPLKASLLQGIAQKRAEMAQRIPVVDATGHERCENPSCMACNSPHKA